jgi:hypothetical protein
MEDLDDPYWWEVPEQFYCACVAYLLRELRAPLSATSAMTRHEGLCIRRIRAMDDTDNLIVAARALITKYSQQHALDGVTVPRGVTSLEVVCTPARARIVVCDDVATIEEFDGRDWKEAWRSAAPASSAPVPEAPAPEQPSRFGPPVPGQVILTADGRWAVAK